MNDVLVLSNTVGGIGMNSETHRGEYEAWERGYKEALLDVFCFLTANEIVLDLDSGHLAMLTGMVENVNRVNGRLETVA